MARPRKPTAALELRGAFAKNPDRGRDRADEPKPTTKIGDPPATFEEDEATAWNEMATEGFWLTGADRFLLEIASKHLAAFRLGAIDVKEISQLITVLNKLGFGPAERSKIKAPGAKEDKPAGFDAFE